MVSNLMFKKSIGGSAGSTPISTNSISVGGGSHDASRVSHTGYPAAEPARPVPPGNPKPKMNGGEGTVEPPKGKAKGGK
jgi:hypothetical protein